MKKSSIHHIPAGMALCALVLVFGSTTGYALAPAPDADTLRAAHLQAAARAALDCGAEYLLGRRGDDERGFIVEPAVRGHTRQGYTVRYTRQTVEEPVYEWDYEEILSTRGEQISAEGGTERELATVKRRIPGSRRQVGTRTVERTVADPNGEIVREVAATRVAERWQHGLLGQNALALYALLAAGVPEDRPEVAQLTATLREHVIEYGCPDSTWDTAWLVAAFSLTQDERNDQAREWLVHKLLNGQITDGPGRGLWGPVCIHTAMLAAMIEAESGLDSELAALRERVERRPNSRALQVQLREREAARLSFIEQYRRVSRQGLRFDDIQERWTVTPDFVHERITAPGLPFYIYNETVADLESAALALFALRIAHRGGHLPEKSWRPQLAQGRPLLRPEAVSAILARSAAAIVRRQQRDGAWQEENLHQPVADFQRLRFQTLDPGARLDLPSNRTLLSSLQGFQSLRALADIMGADRVRVRYGPAIDRARNAALADTEAWLDRQADVPVGRTLEPYDFLLMNAGLQRPFHRPVEDRSDLRKRVLYQTILLQNPDGSWGGGRPIGYSSGTMAYWQETHRQRHRAEPSARPGVQRAAFDADGWWEAHVGRSENLHQFDGAVIGTAYAMAFLADGLHNPMAGYVRETARVPFPATLDAALQALADAGMDGPACIEITPESHPVAVVDLPVLYIDARSPMQDRAVRELVRAHLESPGLLLVETPGSAAGAHMKATLLTLLGNGRAGRIAEAHPLRQALGEHAPELEGVFDAQNRLTAVLIDPRSRSLSARILSQSRSTLASHRNDDDADARAPFERRAAALDALAGRTPVTASSATIRVPNEEDADSERPPRDDEIW